MSKKINEMITERIINAIDEEKKLPWEKPWNGSAVPVNFTTGKPYRGINRILLPMGAQVASFNQIKKAGGHVKKGEKAQYFVTFFKILEKEEDNGEIKKIPMIRYTSVFSIEQTEGCKSKVEPTEKLEFTPVEKAEQIIESYTDRPPITHAGSRAFYTPSSDSVTMPPKENFKSVEAYYRVLFHELAHSTGHSKRLNRESFRKDMEGSAPFGSEPYSREELVAEFTAAFLCAECGISSEKEEKQHAAYLKSWVSTFKNDIYMLHYAAGQAQKAMEYILEEFEKEGEQTNEKAA